mmetsp:Transcript_87541/g.145471  ORF Transcript_87541/g.145471 Transcript_87541/m.145471 type:complete len:460 (-) Transcript_87541:430-1809(-)
MVTAHILRRIGRGIGVHIWVLEQPLPPGLIHCLRLLRRGMRHCGRQNATLCQHHVDLLLQFGTQATERRVRGKRRRVRGHKGVQALLLELVSTEGFCQFEYIADMALPSTQRCVQHGLTYLLQGVEPDGAGGPHDLPGIADRDMALTGVHIEQHIVQHLGTRELVPIDLLDGPQALLQLQLLLQLLQWVCGLLPVLQALLTPLPLLLCSQATARTRELLSEIPACSYQQRAVRPNVFAINGETHISPIAGRGLRRGRTLGAQQECSQVGRQALLATFRCGVPHSLGVTSCVLELRANSGFAFGRAATSAAHEAQRLEVLRKVRDIIAHRHVLQLLHCRPLQLGKIEPGRVQVLQECLKYHWGLKCSVQRGCRLKRQRDKRHADGCWAVLAAGPLVVLRGSACLHCRPERRSTGNQNALVGVEDRVWRLKADISVVVGPMLVHHSEGIRERRGLQKHVVV